MNMILLWLVDIRFYVHVTLIYFEQPGDQPPSPPPLPSLWSHFQLRTKLYENENKPFILQLDYRWLYEKNYHSSKSEWSYLQSRVLKYFFFFFDSVIASVHRAHV